MKKTMIISGSIRKKGTCFNISKLFEKELKNKSSLFLLSEQKIEFCSACLLCDKRKNQNCPIRDDFQIFIKNVAECKNIIFISPIYSGDISGTMKNFIDRTNHYCNFNKWKNKKIFLILTGCIDWSENKKPINRIKQFFKEYADITCCNFEYLGYYKIHPDTGNIFSDYPGIEKDIKKYCKKLI